MPGLLRRYERFLVAVVANPEIGIAHVPLLDAGEQAELLALNPALADDLDGSVALLPDVIGSFAGGAVWDGSVWLSYGDLEARACGFARSLGARGVCRGDVVVCPRGER